MQMFISGLFKPLSRDGNQKGSGDIIDFWVIILLFSTSHSLDLNGGFPVEHLERILTYFELKYPNRLKDPFQYQFIFLTYKV